MKKEIMEIIAMGSKRRVLWFIYSFLYFYKENYRKCRKIVFKYLYRFKYESKWKICVYIFSCSNNFKNNEYKKFLYRDINKM